MRFSVFCGQDAKTIAQADELYLRYKDLDMLIDLVEKYPNKDYVIQINSPDVDWALLQACSKKIEGKIYCALVDMYQAEACKNHDLLFFYAFPVNSFFELKALKDLGVSYIRLGIPIFFQSKDVATFNIPVRLTPNKAYEAYIPRENGIAGQWIRPEDLELYDSVYPNAICEFRTFDIPLEGNHLVYERTLLNIYKNEKHWDGRLINIIKDIGIDNLNSMVDADIGKHRLNCAQVCQLGRCHYCERALKVDKVVLQYKKNKEKRSESSGT